MTDEYDPLYFEEFAGLEPEREAPVGTPDWMLEPLNEPQREAVMFNDGPLLILAGPGSGKTLTVTTRFARLVLDGTPPWRILAITFTNKAAGEMRRRVVELLDRAGATPPERDLWVSTFHSFCARLLRREGDLLEVGSGFTIYDEDDTASVLKQLIKDLSCEMPEITPKNAKKYISSRKMKIKLPRNPEGLPARLRMLEEIYAEYQARLRAAAALDFDDLLLEAVMLLDDHPEILEKYAGRFRYVMIDEFQDTNACQYKLAGLLGSETRNICATGDPDQSIYGWRGAEVKNTFQFEKDFPGTTVIRLEQNYRSTNRILRAASKLISRNSTRKPKRLFSSLGEGEKLRLMRCEDETGEAAEIAGEIEQLRDKEGFALRECAVLYRTNQQSLVLEEAMLRRGIPYVVIGAVAFFQRREVKDVLACLRVMVNPKDPVSFRRIINRPARKIGARSLEMLAEAAAEHGCSLYEAIALDDDALSSIPARALAGMRRFREMIESWKKAEKAGETPAELVRRAVEETGLKDALDPVKDSERIGNLEELVSAAARFKEAHADAAVRDFLENAALVSGVDRWDSSVQAAPLMTLHAAKGLEFDAVFICGCEEDLLPLNTARYRRGGQAFPAHLLEEERRLLFVGMTRARARLTLSFAGFRRRYGASQYMRPSRFLLELPFDELDADFARDGLVSSGSRRNAGRRFSGYGVSAGTGVKPASSEYGGSTAGGFYSSRMREQIEKIARMQRDNDPTSHVEYTEEYTAEKLLDFRPGDIVRSPKFGDGEIEKISGSGENAKAVIYFSRRGRKNLKLALARLNLVKRKRK